jgi:metal iron transporter
MNRPSRTDEPQKGDGYNQSPNAFSNDLTTNADLNGISNTRQRSDDALSIQNSGPHAAAPDIVNTQDPDSRLQPAWGGGVATETGPGVKSRQSPEKGPIAMMETTMRHQSASPSDDGPSEPGSGPNRSGPKPVLHRVRDGLVTFSKFIGPGFMVAVAYSSSIPPPPF